MRSRSTHPSGEVTDGLLKDVKTMVTDSGLKVSVINPFTGKGLYQLAAEDQQGAVDHYALLQDVAVALGAGGVNFLTGMAVIKVTRSPGGSLLMC